MMDVRAWLEQLGFGEYADRFEANKIDAEVLRELDAQDLKDLEIPLGHRKRLIRAIAALAEAPPPGAPDVGEQTSAGSAAGLAHGSSRREGAGPERRHMTVMFCDLAGSTEMSVRLDPEEMHEIIMQYQACCERAVRRYNGYVASYLGDGLLVYFGYPRADEHDPERAVRTGLDIVEEVRRLDVHPDVQLHSRVGIATGRVVVGDTIGQGGALKHEIVGETPNLAARLQGLAARDAVAIAEDTRRLVPGLFELQDLGLHQLKGFKEKVQVWQVSAERAVEGRFAASRQGTDLTPLTGRDEEFGLLKARWQQAVGGKGQVVLLSGESGIGKSRLTQAVCEHVGDVSVRVVRCHCSPYHANSALFPVIDLLQRLAAIQREMPARERLSRLEAVLENAGMDDADAGPLLAALLLIPANGLYALPALSAQKLKERTLQVLTELVKARARWVPVLFVFEDLHWIDPTTLEFLGRLVAEVREHRVLVLATHRPGFDAPWQELSHATTIPLDRLSPPEIAQAVVNVAGKPLPARVVERIVDKSDGVPLFVEELTKTLLMGNYLIDAGDRYVTDGDLPAFAVPDTLQDLLMARLDQLAPVKEVALLGSVIGRQFSYELLAALAPLGARELEEALQRLVDAQLIYRRGTIPEATFTFKHSLVQDAAYRSLLRSKRLRLHAALAELLETRFPAIAAEQPEVLAHHYEWAGLISKAIAYLRSAGEQSLQRSANAEAINHLTHALELIERLPEPRDPAEDELPVLLMLGAGYTMSKGWATAEAEAVYRRAKAACEDREENLEHFPVYLALHRFHALRGELKEADRVGERLLAHAEVSGDETYVVPANVAHGYNSFFLGELRRAETHLDKGVAFYDPGEHAFWISRWGEDPGIVGLGFGSLTHCLLGNREKAIELNAAGLDTARASGHQFSIAFSLWISTRLQHILGNTEAVGEIAEELLDLSTEQNLLAWLGHALIMRGWAMCSTGEGGEGLRLIADGLAGEFAAGALLHRTQYLALLAEAHGIQGDPATGLQAIADAEAVMAKTSEGYAEPEIHRIKGTLLALSGADRDEVRRCFETAIAAAKRRHATAWERRTREHLSALR